MLNLLGLVFKGFVYILLELLVQILKEMLDLFIVKS